MNLITAKAKVKKLIDAYSERGNAPSEQNTVDYELKLNDYFDIAQKEIATVKNITRVYSVGHYLPENLLGNSAREYIRTDTGLTFSAKGKSYYFEVTGSCTITIKADDTEETLFNNSKNYRIYKGSYDCEELTISFSSAGVYAVRNVAIFAPAGEYHFGEYTPFALPDDFHRVYKITLNNKEPDHYFSGRMVYVKRCEQGELVIEYAAMPETITDATGDFYEFEIAEELQEAMCFYVAALLMQSENPSVYTILLSEYKSKLVNATTEIYPTQKRVRRVHS